MPSHHNSLLEIYDFNTYLMEMIALLRPATYTIQGHNLYENPSFSDGSITNIAS